MATPECASAGILIYPKIREAPFSGEYDSTEMCVVENYSISCVNPNHTVTKYIKNV